MGRWLDIALLFFAVAVIIFSVITGVMLAHYCISSTFTGDVCQALTYMPHSWP